MADHEFVSKVDHHRKLNHGDLFTRCLWQFSDFYFSNLNSAAWIMLLKCKVPFLESKCEIHVFIQLVSIHCDLDSGQVSLSPNIIANFDFIGKPLIGFDESFVDMAHAVQ